MKNNIFVNNKLDKNDKFNPDIKVKFNDIQNNRNLQIFKKSNNFYNPITGINDNNKVAINLNNDKLDLNKLIADKENERKILDNNIIFNKNLNNDLLQNSNINNFNSFNDLKKNSQIISNDNDNIIKDLEKLGIIN